MTFMIFWLGIIGLCATGLICQRLDRIADAIEKKAAE